MSMTIHTCHTIFKQINISIHRLPFYLLNFFRIYFAFFEFHFHTDRLLLNRRSFLCYVFLCVIDERRYYVIFFFLFCCLFRFLPHMEVRLTRYYEA